MKKVISIVALSLIFVCGLSFVGCGEKPGSLLISLDESKIEMLISSEPKDYQITVENYTGEVSFDFGFENNIAMVVADSVHDNGGGKYKFSIAPISSGTTTLTITLRGTSKLIKVPVVISEELESFSCKQNLFVKRGESLTLASSMFNFIPSTTTLKNLSFTLKDAESVDSEIVWNEETNTILVGENTIMESLTFIATSIDDPSKTLEFIVRIVSDVDISSLNIFAISQKPANKEQFDEVNGRKLVYGYSEDELVYESIELITNIDTQFRKLISVEYEFDGQYAIEVSSSSGIWGDITEGAPITNMVNNFGFKIQANEPSKKDEPYSIFFKIYQKDFKENCKIVEIKVYALTIPKEIRINSKTNVGTVNLYHNNNVSSDFRFSVFPSLSGNQNEEKYTFTLGVYESSDGVRLDRRLDLDTIEKYMNITYGSLPLYNLANDPSGYAEVSGLNNLNSILSVTPKLNYSNYFVIKADCFNEDDKTTPVCSNQIVIKIFKGTGDFLLDERYALTKTIYVPMSKGDNPDNILGTQNFSHFVYDKDSTIGDLIISAKDITNIVCDVEQVFGTDDVTIAITPREVGETDFVIQTENGKSIDLKIVVFREIDETNFALVFDDTYQNPVSNFSYKEKTEFYNHDTLQNFEIRGSGETVYLKNLIHGYDDTNELSYNYSMEVDTTHFAQAIDYIEIVDNNKIISKDFTNQNIQIKLTLNLFKWNSETFLIEPNLDTQIQTFDFQVTCIDYIKKVNLSVSDGSVNSAKTKVITVYNKNDLSYINQNLAVAYIYLDLQTCGGVYKLLNQENITSKWSTTVSGFNPTTGKVGSIGYFYKTEYDEDGNPVNGVDYIGKFVCDISGINSIANFTITLKLNDQTKNSGFESTITINIGEYIDVDNIYLTTATDSIYLDGTEKNSTTSVGVYMLPTNAMCKDIQIIVDSTTPNCIAYEIKGDIITFKYIRGGFGIIRIFPVSEMKTSSPRDEYGNYYYHIALSFNCADGSSPEKALRLSTYEDLDNLKNSSSYYFIDSTIDCAGKELYIPSFYGYIRGTFAVAPDDELLIDTGDEKINKENLEKYNEQKEIYDNSYQLGTITNFVVKYKGLNSGLFGIFGGKLENITIQGSFENITWNIEQTSNIGLICGTNKGVISNVLVSLINNTNDSGQHLVVKNNATSQVTVNVGLVAGANDGTIEITKYAKNTTMFINLQDKFISSFEDNQVKTGTETVTYSLTSYLGGVVGINNLQGIIQNTHQTEDNLTIGLYGINVNVQMSTNASYLGGVVASTSGNILDIKAIGSIVNTKVSTTTYTAGLVAVYANQESQVKNNVSRIFVKSNGTIAGLIANVEGVTNFVNITGNKVQATDSGKIGLEASLLVKRNDGDIYPLAPSTLSADNIAETYVDRMISPTFVQYLPIEQYYGEIVVTNNAENKIERARQFTRGTDENVSADVTKFVLAVFKQAKNKDEQKNISNIVSVAAVLKDIAKVNGTEFNISVDKQSVVSVANYGKNFNVNSTGFINLTVTSSLNYKSTVNLEIYITNAFENFKVYEDKDHLFQTSSIKASNNQTKNVHLNCFYGVYNYKNTPIEILDNSEVIFEAKEREGEDLLYISTIGQTVFVGAKEPIDASLFVDIYPIMKIDEILFYAQRNNRINAYVFTQNPNEKESTELFVEVVTGIENITIGKASVLAEPTNDVEFEITYDTYNNDDYLNLSIESSYGKYDVVWDDISKSSGTFFDNAGNKLFVISRKSFEEKNMGEFNSVKSVYEFKMELNKDNYYNYKNETVNLTLQSAITGDKDSLSIEYSPETIAAVLTENYNYEDNEGMIDEKRYDLSYYEQHMIKQSKYSSTGDYNILKTYVYTKLGEFDFLEVSMNAGVTGGYLALGKTVEIEVDGEIVEKGITNKNIVYTSIDGVVTLRANKSDIISDKELFGESGRMLEITIIYSLPTSLDDGITVPISLSFFKHVDGEIISCYPTENVYVVSRAASRVEFTISGKESDYVNAKELERKATQSYSVVKGKTYVLETDIFGYKDDEVVFESSNPNVASVTYMDGLYYLTIQNVNLTYNNEEEYFPVTISSYGRKLENNAYKKGKVQTTALRIYEFLIDDDNVFVNDTISLRALTNSNIADEVIANLNLESATYGSFIESFKSSFKEKSNWKMISNGIELELPIEREISTTLYKLKGFEIQPLKIMDVAPYQFEVEYSYTYKNGVPTCDIGENDIKRFGRVKFNVEVYINTTEELPSPIDSYEDLINVKDDEYYILSSDIVIPAPEFTSITTKPKMLDGNGYKIIINGGAWGANLQNITNFALFESVQSGAVFKNITIVLQNSTNIQIDNNYMTSGVNVGILTAVNEGIITNCYIQSQSTINVNVLGTVTVMENSYFGTICALNRGYITNSRVEASIKVSGVSVGGVVANNEGKISSTYIKNSRIVNEVGSSNENIVTGGFVCTNIGTISMCYIEGKQSNNKIFADFTAGSENNSSSVIIYTSSVVGGFLYENSGTIYDCYANIPVVSTNRCAGFVAINNGTISRAFSLSKMKKGDTINFGFVISYGEDSKFEDCFFVMEKGVINENTSASNYDSITLKGIIPGVEPLQIKDFNILDKTGKIKQDTPFKNYIVGSSSADTSGIWFYAYEATKADLITDLRQTYLSEVSNFNYYDVSKKEYISQVFTAGVLQLSSPNLISSSRKTLNILADDSYSYSEDDSVVALGTKYNPYLISSTKELEQYGNQKGNIFKYYRLVCDIDYEKDKVYNSALVNKTIFGYIEGNNFDISNYSVNAKSSYLTSGLIGQFGRENGALSTMKNINFYPNYVNLPNSTFVGGIAGTIVQAKVYNVKVEGSDVVISGKNFVGGIAGRTLGQTYFNNVYSNVVAKSAQFGSMLTGSKDDISLIQRTFTYNESSSKRATSSYAGGVIGYVGGSSRIVNAKIGEQTKAFGIMAGLMFGGLGSFAYLTDVNLTLNSYENEIRAYAFGGIVTGENKGIIDNIQINSDILHKKLFSVYPIIPVAIGGVAGVMSGGLINNLNSTKGFAVIGADFTNRYLETSYPYVVAQVNNPYVVKHVGGLVGFITEGDISNINIFGLKENQEGNGAYDLDSAGKIVKNTSNTGKFDKDGSVGLIVSGANYVGGLVGLASSKNTTISNINVNLIGHKKYINQDGNEIDELIYTSYVSEVSSYLIPDFSSDYFVGAWVGKDENSKGSEYEEETINVEVTDTIYTYYALYDMDKTKDERVSPIGNLNDYTSKKITADETYVDLG